MHPFRHRTSERFAARRDAAETRREPADPDDAGLVGQSLAVARIRADIARVAPVDVTVLVTGESGTGKEVVARALHARSIRATHPFVTVDCGAISADALDGGWSPAERSGTARDESAKRGLLAKAEGGTLFLDEVGEASPAVQNKLVRILEDQSPMKASADSTPLSGFRVVAATHRDLRADVMAGRFREDLFFRLHVVPIHLPPLRERLEDLAALADQLLHRMAERLGIAPPRLDRSAIDALSAHSWPGNVRELANVLQATLLLADGGEITADRLAGFARTGAGASSEPAEVRLDRGVHAALSGHDPLPSLKDARDAMERTYLAVALRRARGNVTAAARMAGRNRTDFYCLLRKHSLSPADFKSVDAASTGSEKAS